MCEYRLLGSGRRAYRIARQKSSGLIILTLIIGLAFSHPLLGQTNSSSLKVSGVVTLPDGKPASQANVYLLRRMDGESITLPTHPEVARTDVSGRYVFDTVQVGMYQLWAETTQFTSLEKKLQGKRIEVGDGYDSNQQFNLTLHEGCRYVVNVIDKASRKAIEGADISFGWTDIERNYKTDAMGLVEIAGLAIDEWYFVIRADKYAINYRKLPQLPLGSKTELDFELDPGAALHGVVQDTSGKPIVGAELFANESQPAMTPGLGRTTSDREGKFRFPSLPFNTTMRVSARAEGFLSFNTTVTIPVDEADFNSNIRLEKRPYGGDSIVRVVDENGVPIKGAQIENMGNSSMDVRTAQSDEQGRAKLADIFTGFRGANASVRASGFISQSVQLTVGSREAPGETIVQMVKGESIQGRLLKPDGAPAAGIRVYYNGGERGFSLGGRVVTDKEGRFSIDGLPNPCTFTFYTLAPHAPIRDLALPVGGEEEVVVQMEYEGVIRIRAIDKLTNKPIPEYNVQVTFTRDRRPNDPMMPLNTSLSNPGTEILGTVKEFRLGQLPQGMPLQVIVTAKGFAKEVLARVEAGIEMETPVMDVQLSREDDRMLYAVAGHLVDSQGKPVAGANMRLIIGKGQPSTRNPWSRIESGDFERDLDCLQFLSTTTKKDGSFSFERVKPGDWIEIAHFGGHTSNGRYINAKPENTNAWTNLRLEAFLPGKIAVRVNRESFSEAHSVSLSPSDGQLYSHVSKVLENKQTEIVFDGLPDGKYTIRLNGKPTDVGNGGFTSKALTSTDVKLEENGNEVVNLE